MLGWVAGIATNVVLAIVLFLTAAPMGILPAGLVVFLFSSSVKGFYLRNYYE
jgi:hypothetical protein